MQPLTAATRVHYGNHIPCVEFGQPHCLQYVAENSQIVLISATIAPISSGKEHENLHDHGHR